MAETVPVLPSGIDIGVLEGYAIGVTADRRAAEQIELLRRRGGRVVHGPTIRTLPLGPDDGIRPVTEALIAAPPDVLIANTGIGIRSWFAAAESWGKGVALHEALAASRIVARGPKAAGAVITAGLDVAWRAPSERLDDVVAELERERLVGLRVAIQLDGDSEHRASRRLRAAGAKVVEVPVYRWTLPTDPGPALRLVEAACTGRLEAVTFTSAAATRNLIAIADAAGRGPELRRALNDGVLAMCVGPVCAQAAADCGISGLQPARPRLGAMVQALTTALACRRVWLRVAGADLLVQGTLVVVDGERMHLAERERAVLSVLVRRPGAVVSRGELLRIVWGESAARGHALEVTIARLRRRLGGAGAAVETVVRRGYRFAGEPVDGAA